MNEKRRIGVTDCLMCKRRLVYKYKNTEKLSYHYWTFRGILTHRMIEEYIKGTGGIEEVYDSLIEGFEESGELPGYGLSPKLKQEVIETTQKFRDWYDEKMPEFTQMERYFKSERFHGRIDMLCKNELIDFKSGKMVTDKLKMQLAAYVILCEENGIPINSVKLVMLGKDPKKMDVDITDKIDEYKAKFLQKLNEAEVVLSSDEMPEAEIGIECVYCPYVHLCRG